MRAARRTMKSRATRVADADEASKSLVTPYYCSGSLPQARTEASCCVPWTSMPDYRALSCTRSASPAAVNDWTLLHRDRHLLETFAARGVGAATGQMAFPLGVRLEAAGVLWFEPIAGAKGEVPCPPFGEAVKARWILGRRRPVWARDHRLTAGRWTRTCWLSATAEWPKLHYPAAKTHPNSVTIHLILDIHCTSLNSRSVQHYILVWRK